MLRQEQLVKHHTQDKNRLDNGVSTGARPSAQQHIAWLYEEIARPKEEYQALLQSMTALAAAEAAELYRSLPGVGLLTAATLVAELPELGRPAMAVYRWCRRGWCPGPGTEAGNPERPGSDTASVVPGAQSAARHHGDLREFYQGLLSRGKPGKVVLAVMRKQVLHRKRHRRPRHALDAPTRLRPLKTA